MLLDEEEERGRDVEEVWGLLMSSDSASSLFIFSGAGWLRLRVLCLGLGLGGSTSVTE